MGLINTWYNLEYFGLSKYEESYRHAVVAVNTDGEPIALYQNATRASSMKGYWHSSISRCINGKQKTHRGVQWFRISSNELTDIINKEVIRSQKTKWDNASWFAKILHKLGIKDIK